MPASGQDGTESEAERMPVTSGVGRTTREYLKACTAPSHDRLDGRLGTLTEGGERDYADFLEIQYRARQDVELWLADHAPTTAPPGQTGLIAQDLETLGRAAPTDFPALETPADADPIGVCWVLAGSSLGNRAILARLAKTGMQWPTAFLSDRRMTAYWQDLRPILERPHSPDRDRAALAAAQATFAHFNAVVAHALSPVAA
ncbi:biliverdin-producing heme oxygenase [Erythrobacter sp.]|uniref:biliverdin-producing heme oxygenase n=1 Tax=Erythrobacter sp. TaxID=1042 RepID=UPI001B28358B|nr:biliverdin-producing heme oxygenase [Erythrobacter sp.]MBO6526580.1 biliverdin-producing heme oxygenase [Erythrobacter sp.]MBO6529208.1 biliverdin-producing heme oxygenase [Erythrobacter sp.]